MSYKIRFMRKEDLPQVVEIDKEAFPTQWPPTSYRSELQNKLAHYMVVYQDVIEHPGYKQPVAKNSGFICSLKNFFGCWDNIAESMPVQYIVGFVGSWIMADELHITEIAVRSSCRRQKIGHFLLVAMLELGLKYKAKEATLEVRVSNKSAQQLYAKFGFEARGRRKGYYNDNKEDALIMTTIPIYLPDFQERLAGLKKGLLQTWGLTALPSVEGKDLSG